jgi:hypothetical protein
VRTRDSVRVGAAGVKGSGLARSVRQRSPTIMTRRSHDTLERVEERAIAQGCEVNSLAHQQGAGQFLLATALRAIIHLKKKCTLCIAVLA